MHPPKYMNKIYMMSLWYHIFNIINLKVFWDWSLLPYSLIKIQNYINWFFFFFFCRNTCLCNIAISLRTHYYIIIYIKQSKHWNLLQAKSYEEQHLKNMQWFVNYVPIISSKTLILDNLLSSGILFGSNGSCCTQCDNERTADTKHGPSNI